MKVFALAAALMLTLLPLRAPAETGAGALPAHATTLVLNAQLKSNLWRQVVGEYAGTMRLHSNYRYVSKRTHHRNSFRSGRNHVDVRGHAGKIVKSTLMLRGSALVALVAFAAYGLIGVRADAAVVHYRPSHPITVKYETSLRGNSVRNEVGGYFAGTMRLTFHPDGILQGTYVPDAGNPIPVTGGIEDSGRVWLSIGTRNRMTVNGHVHQGGWIEGIINGPRRTSVG
jgi:hypothetical protein